jgi:hypothetical protein
VLLVIFGAGASYDSVPDLPPPIPPQLATRPLRSSRIYEDERLPLASQLFDNRPRFVEAMMRFPDCKALIPSLRKPGVMVEQELAKIQSQAKTFPSAYQELAAIRYYLHFALWECQRRWSEVHRGITNYAALLRELERWRFESTEQICFVTFNYDTMLEEAMEQVLHFQIPTLDLYISQKNYALIKLHGSINWGREIEGTSVHPGNYDHQRLIREAASLRISDRYTVVSEHPMLKRGDTLLFPALSIPVENKDEFSCPQAHVKALEVALPKVTKVLIVGWRATEQDFLDRLQYKLPEKPDLMIVSGDANGAGETYSNLTRRGPTRYRYTHHGENGFTGLIMNSLGLLDAFLRDGTSG